MKYSKQYKIGLLIAGILVYLMIYTFCNYVNLNTDTSVVFEIAEGEFHYIADVTDSAFARFCLHSFCAFVACSIATIIHLIISIALSIKKEILFITHKTN